MNRTRLARTTVIVGFALVTWAGLLRGQSVEPADPKATAAQIEAFEKEVRPLLVARCYKCHAAEAKRVRGNLRLDTRAGLLKGGDLGPAVVPGDPDRSLLIRAVRHDDPGLQMPPDGRLTPSEIGTLEKWVRAGMPTPPDDSRDVAAAGPARPAIVPGEWWSFRPAREPDVPAVRDDSWPRNAIDRFMLARLEAAGIRPATEADRRTLIRRLAFDLTGLPPSPEEVAAFVSDETPGAYERLVERLLASPAYGERWGRHWLDVARYADSNGMDENVAHGNAWRYRDYVIAAFQADKPFDRFLTEQLAGDLLPPDDSPAPAHERRIATGFLAMGPKVLAEVDERKMEMDIVDEQVDVVGRTFLGLTLGCARCHDHKFDPISQADYYGLAGVFKSTRTMETFKKVARWHENSLAAEADLARKAAHEAEVAAGKDAIRKRADEANGRLRAEKGAGFELPRMPETLYPPETQADLKRLRDELAELEKAAPEMPSAMGVAEGPVADVPIHIRGSHLTLGAIVPRRVPRALAVSAAPPFGPSQSGRLELARWLAGADHPLTGRVMVNRIWRWHFGRGLVGTPDNFGALGERPSHPELLDWLARRFVEGGWSVKAMHRLIVASSTYRAGGNCDPAAIQSDPDNRLFGRAAIRRLDAEEIRDALLAVAGSLDRTMGGSLLRVKNRDYFFDHTSRDATDYDRPRRSVYLPVVRNHLYDIFQLFDFPDPGVTSGDRATTTVAPQSLFLMNSDLVLGAARDLAAHLLARDGLDDAGRVALLYEQAYGRPPEPAEIRRASTHLARLGGSLGDVGGPGEEESRRRGAWQALCQAILASNEFLSIR